jgi:hypothetical protein
MCELFMACVDALLVNAYGLNAYEPLYAPLLIDPLPPWFVPPARQNAIGPQESENLRHRALDELTLGGMPLRDLRA